MDLSYCSAKFIFKKTCLVMDNASYHNVISPEDKVPKMSMKKDIIIAWLLKQGIDHNSAKKQLRSY